MDSGVPMDQAGEAPSQVKLVQVLGPEFAPPKAQARCGSLDLGAVKLADEALRKEQELRKEELFKAKPTAQQMQIPEGSDIPVAVKALEILGSEELSELSLKSIPNKTQLHNRTKLVQKFGAVELADSKPQSILGADTEGDIAARVKADRELEAEQESLRKRHLDGVINAKPTGDQLAVPKACEKASVGEPLLPSKALQLMGDEGLETASREYVPSSTVIKPKAMEKLGEAKTLPAKAVSRLGSLTKDMIARKLSDEQMVKEALAKRNAMKD